MNSNAEQYASLIGPTSNEQAMDKNPTEIPVYSMISGIVVIANDNGLDQSTASESRRDVTKILQEESVTSNPTLKTHDTTVSHSGSLSCSPRLPEDQYRALIVSPMLKLPETSEAYQNHFLTYVNMGKSRAGSDFFEVSTILDHIVSSWIEKGGCFNHQGQTFNVGQQLFECILENHWNPSMYHDNDIAELALEMESTHDLLSHGIRAIDVTNENVVTLGSDCFSEEFMYHIYGYAKVHAKNINHTITRYRNSKRCLKHWYKNGGKLTDIDCVELSYQEALCVMERILWRHSDEWLNEYIVI